MLLSVILLNNRVCWSDVDITTLGKLTKKSTWCFYAKSSLPWDHLFKESISTIIKTGSFDFPVGMEVRLYRV